MNKAGFTLMELLVVVIMAGVLTSIAMPQYRKAMDRAKAAEAMEILPALFEARERWMIEHQCVWTADTEYSCSDGESASIRKLDIEFPGTYSGNMLTTKHFVYDLFPGGSGTNTNQLCVSAVPLWGANRNLTGATIYFRGDKFSCDDEEAPGACDILNIADDAHRTGCI